MVKSLVEVFLVLRLICDTWKVDCYNANRSCAFAGTEESSGLLPELSEIKAETAAHRPYIGRLHIGVDVVGEIRRAILCSHLEKKLVILILRPVEILRDGVCRDRILESSTLRISFDHYLDEGLVDHISFLLAFAICEAHVLSADKSRNIPQVLRDYPVESDVCERCLGSPSGWSVHTIYE